MIKLAVFDVDGTLVSHEHKLLESTKETMIQLRKQGVKIAIASGRPPFFVRLGLDELISFDYYICSNGTFVENGEGKELYRNGFSLEEVDELTKDFKQSKDSILFQFDDAAYVYNGYKKMNEVIGKWIGKTDLLINHENEVLRHKESLPFAAVTEIAPEHIDTYKTKYKDFRFESFTPNHYDIYKASSSKADGIRTVCKELGIDMSEVIAFGDNNNDMKMIQQVGIGVAMGKAIDELKHEADYITKGVEEDGIYLACKHFELF